MLGKTVLLCTNDKGAARRLAGHLRGAGNEVMIAAAAAAACDLVNARATWVDEPAFRDGNLVWGRVVPDIPAFCRELVAAIEAGQPS